MKTTKPAAALLFTVLFAFNSVFPAQAQSAKPQKTLSVEGEWELISVNTDNLQKDIGKRLSITRQGSGYEVRWLGDQSVVTYSGNDTGIVNTSLVDLGDERGSFIGGRNLPAVVKQQVAGKKVPINVSFTLSADGSFLKGETDMVWFYYWKETNRFERYEIAPGYIKKTFKRISGPPAATKATPPPAPTTAPAPAPAKKTETTVFAAVVARGEFYVLTKDGRKLTGAEANKVPLAAGAKVVAGKSGYVQLLLPDETVFTLGSNTEVEVDEFIYDPHLTPKKVMVNVTKGVFRWVTGKVKNPEAAKAEWKVRCHWIEGGIRGTDFEMVVEPKGRGRLALFSGQMEITEIKTGFTFILNGGQMITFTLDGKVSRPKKIKGGPMLEDEED
jgi:hypothetical protein